MSELENRGAIDFSLSPNKKTPTCGSNNRKGYKTLLWKQQRKKDIGVTFDGQLSFDEHINSKVKKANIIEGVIRRSYKFVSVKTLKHLQKNNRSNKRSVEKYNKIPAGETFLMMYYVPVLCVVCLFHFLFWRAPWLALLLWLNTAL